MLTSILITIFVCSGVFSAMVFIGMLFTTMEDNKEKPHKTDIFKRTSNSKDNIKNCSHFEIDETIKTGRNSLLAYVSEDKLDPEVCYLIEARLNRDYSGRKNVPVTFNASSDLADITKTFNQIVAVKKEAEPKKSSDEKNVDENKIII